MTISSGKGACNGIRQFPPVPKIKHKLLNFPTRGFNLNHLLFSGKNNLSFQNELISSALKHFFRYRIVMLGEESLPVNAMHDEIDGRALVGLLIGGNVENFRVDAQPDERHLRTPRINSAQYDSSQHDVHLGIPVLHLTIQTAAFHLES